MPLTLRSASRSTRCFVQYFSDQTFVQIFVISEDVRRLPKVVEYFLAIFEDVSIICFVQQLKGPNSVVRIL